jgi:diguanylate cyclase (GGDEF)-like protein
MAAVVCVFAALGLCGYAFSIDVLYRPIAGGAASHPLTLSSALLLGLSLLGKSRPRAAVAAGLVFLIAGLRLVPNDQAQSVFNALTPFAGVVHHDREAGLSNAMGQNTALMFLLISLSVLLVVGRRPRESQTMAFLAMAVPMVSITGYAYSLPQFYGSMSLITVTLGMPLAAACAAGTAHHGMLRAILSPYVTGRIARVQIILGYLAPFFGGYLLIKAIGQHGDTSLFGVFVVSISWFIIILISVSSMVHERIDRARRFNERALAKSASVDVLTGVFNRRAFDQHCEEELVRCRRSGQPLSLVMMDIDYFKRVNDTGGHPIGDLVLTRTARLVKGHVRAIDTVGRLGGEEFAVLLPDTTCEGAAYKAESLRRLIESLRFDPWPGHDGCITASFGCATLQPGERISDLLRRADEALYRAKTSGRNQVIAVNLAPCATTAVEPHIPA